MEMNITDLIRKINMSTYIYNGINMRKIKNFKSFVAEKISNLVSKVPKREFNYISSNAIKTPPILVITQFSFSMEVSIFE